MKTEKINLFYGGYTHDAHTGRISCKDVADIQSKVDIVLKEHPDWRVSSLDFNIENGELCGMIHFRLPTVKPKTKRYEVSWVERCTCYSTVEAKNKKEARRIAEENFPEEREYDATTQWKITEIK